MWWWKKPFFKEEIFSLFCVHCLENGWNYHSAVSFWLVEKVKILRSIHNTLEEKMRVGEVQNSKSFELKFSIASDLAMDSFVIRSREQRGEILPKLLLFWMNISLRFLVLGQFTNRALHSLKMHPILQKKHDIIPLLRASFGLLKANFESNWCNLKLESCLSVILAKQRVKCQLSRKVLGISTFSLLWHYFVVF